MNRELQVLSAFTGAGGLDLGLELAGLNTIACLETDPSARAVLEKNRSTWLQWQDGDVHRAAERLRPQELGFAVGDLDIVAGGPPCQPFSTAAQWARNGKRGMLDERALTLFGFMDIVESFLPRAVFVENVPGFLSGDPSPFALLSGSFERINAKHGTTYRVYGKVLNAADYGVPQNRRRAIVIAIRDSVAWSWPEATHHENPCVAWDALSDLKEAHTPALRGRWAELLPSIPEGHNYQWLTSAGGGQELFGRRTKFWNFLLKLAKDKPSWTLPASPGPASGPFHWDNRPLSIREKLRLQSFPDEWELFGGNQDQSRMVGNATPPLLSEVIGRQLMSVLAGKRFDELPSLLRYASTDPAPAVAPRPVPETFFSLVGPKSPHAGTGKGPSPRINRLDEGT